MSLRGQIGGQILAYPKTNARELLLHEGVKEFGH